MQLLLRSRENKGLTWGVVVSAAIHVVLLGAVVLAYRAAPDRRTLVEEFVTYLVPPPKEASQQGGKAMDWEGPGGKGTGAQPGSAASRRGPKPVPEPPADSGGQGDLAATPALVGDTVLTEVEVDSAVRRYPESAGPDYPATMLTRSLEGRVLATYVVDTTGMVDTSSFRVIEATHPDFAEAVRLALPKMRFHPAILGGNKVRQLVQQAFGFRINRPDSTPPPRAKPPVSPSPALSGGMRDPD